MIIKMVKMGLDIDETRNHRIRGIIPTEDDKFLFIEISKGNRPKRSDTSLSPTEYEKKYPHEEYIMIDGCFRVDLPEDLYKNYTAEYKEFDRTSFKELKHSKENIVELLKRFNKNINDIELVDDYYLDEFCEEKGFFRLYDDRLKHKYSPSIVIWSDLEKDGETDVKCLYTCYSANGTEYSQEMRRTSSINEMIQEYGKQITEILIDEYIDELIQETDKPEMIKHLQDLKNELFEENSITETMEQEDKCIEIE